MTPDRRLELWFEFLIVAAGVAVLAGGLSMALYPHDTTTSSPLPTAAQIESTTFNCSALLVTATRIKMTCVSNERSSEHE